MTVAGLLAYVLAELLALPRAYWAASYVPDIKTGPQNGIARLTDLPAELLRQREMLGFNRCKTTYEYHSRGVSYGASQTDSYRQACH